MTRRSPSERFVSTVGSFVAGTHLYGQPRASSYEICLDIRKLKRQIKEINMNSPIDGSPPRKTGAIERWFDDWWDHLVAYMTAVMFACLRIALFFLLAGLLLMAVPTLLQWR